jgi:hypothetical protein
VEVSVRDPKPLRVVEAYRRASASGKSTPDCYLAAVDVLHRLYPDARRALVATEAVRIITSDVAIGLTIGIGLERVVAAVLPRDPGEPVGEPKLPPFSAQR